MTIHRWYGRRRRTVEVYSQTAVWYHTGLPPVPIRWYPRPPKRCCRPICASRPGRTFFMHETTFEEARAHLGMPVVTERLLAPLSC